MDATFRPHNFSAEMFAYAENKKIFEIFQNILERLTVDRPEKPLSYLYDLLTKEAVYDVPTVYVLGPPTVDRTLVCTSLALKLGLMHITCDSLVEEENESESIPPNWTDLVKKRIGMPDCARHGWILEGFPTTRNEAFILRKTGVFPTHIVVVEPYDLLEVNTEEMPEETKKYLGQKMLILDLHRNSFLKTFIIGPESDTAADKVLEFVRSKIQPPMPYLPRVLIFGPYGSGRKTVAKHLAEKYNLVEVNYQQELRRAAMKDSPLKERISAVLKVSSPIPDEILVEVASRRLMQGDCVESGWVMYNFPDTTNQAELLTKALEGFQVNRAVFLDASLKVCLDRVEPRRLDPSTGKMYHFKLNPFKQTSCIDRLIQLPQDTAESVEAEHRFYTENMEQLKLFFRQELSTDITVEVNADNSKEDTFEAVQGAILKSNKMKLSG